MKQVRLTEPQQQALTEARVAFMQQCPFLSHYYLGQLKEFPTLDVDTAATDMRRVFINPEYFMTLRPGERAFVLAHETYHCIYLHPTRMRHYGSARELKPGLPYDGGFFNVCADWVINAQLIANKIGICNPEWLVNSGVTGTELVEDVYEAHYKKPPTGTQGGGKQPPGGGGVCPPGQPSQNPGNTQGKGKPSVFSDKKAKANGGRFDEVLDPVRDPVSGADDVPDEITFKQAVAAAAQAAKGMGKMPGSFQVVVDSILEPQVAWQEHLRMVVTGHIGHDRDDWRRPNRRRIVLNPIIYLPGKRGHGCDKVAVVIDNSGSILTDERILQAFFGEAGGIITDCRPKRVILIWADAAVRKVDEASSLDELAHIRVQGAPGGGGTSFIPAFEYLEENQIRPDTLIYLTDMEGLFPKEAPPYPVVWCSITDRKGPFGETVRIKI